MLIVPFSSVNWPHFALHILKDEYPGNAAISYSTFDAVALCISLGGTAFINIYILYTHINFKIILYHDLGFYNNYYIST